MQEVIEHLKREGYETNEFIPDGKIHRFKLDPKDDKKSGFYVGYQNFSQKTGETFYVVKYGSWREGLESAKTFSSLRETSLTVQDRKLVQQQINEAKKKAEKEREEIQERASKECQEKWDTLSETGISEYLTKKQVQNVPNLGIRYDLFTGDIYVPARDCHGKLWSLQKINVHGKWFYPGGRIRGSLHYLGANPDESETIYFAEGLSTGASISLATGECVVCCFSKGGFLVVAPALRKKYPEKRFIICGDDDKKNDQENDARKAIERIAVAVGGIAVFPKIENGTDFNDVHCQFGIEEVKKQLSVLPTVIEVDPTFVVDAEYPDENPKTGKRLATIENLREMLRRLGIIVRYNIIHKKIEFLIPNSQSTIDNQANAALAEISSWCERCLIPSKNIKGALLKIADSNAYNPLAIWIQSKPWDGESRLQEFLDTVKSTNEPLKEKLIRKWLISCIAAIFEPEGISAHGVLVFRGDQYLGKTMWFKQLAPSHLRVLGEGKFLKPDDKDSVFPVVSNWIVELGELDATFRKADISQLKAFLTKDRDVLRRPYAELDSEFPRRTVFFGSVNESDYLKDPTGNRRFWTIDCEKIDCNHKVDMQQLWSEIYELYKSGEKWILDAEEMKLLNEHNNQFQSVESVEERIAEKIRWEPRDYLVECHLSATQICQEIGILNPSNGECRAAGRFARKKTLQPIKNVHGISKFVCYIPSRIN